MILHTDREQQNNDQVVNTIYTLLLLHKSMCQSHKAQKQVLSRQCCLEIKCCLGQQFAQSNQQAKPWGQVGCVIFQPFQVTHESKNIFIIIQKTSFIFYTFVGIYVNGSKAAMRKAVT